MKYFQRLRMYSQSVFVRGSSIVVRLIGGAKRLKFERY